MSRAAARAARTAHPPVTVRIVPASVLARVLDKDARTIARWCDDGDIEHYVQGRGFARRYQIVVRNGHAVVFGVAVPVPDDAK